VARRLRLRLRPRVLLAATRGLPAVAVDDGCEEFEGGTFNETCPCAGLIACDNEGNGGE
jgi:hypothetical protein